MKIAKLALERPSRAAAAPPAPATFEPAAPAARLNITLPAALHSEIKTRAAARGQTIRAYLLALLARDGVDVSGA